ncbi:MAG TPA: calcium-binding EGF-like domain-containing protein, partial [Kofleriaceae bacterium]|nr:calcium-binding EGF-like domain-containing protein [Kofleriaceae bacterium]
MQRCIVLFALVACSGTTGPGGGGGGGGDDDIPPICDGITCSDHGTCTDVGGVATCQCDGGYIRGDATTCVAAVGPEIAGCPSMPVDYIFNTPIDALPVDPNSDAYIATITAARKLHLDLGTTTDQQAGDFYGIPYNIVHGASFTWPVVAYLSTDPDLDWNPQDESDCAAAGDHTIVSPCTAGSPALPIPANVIV